MAMSSPLEFCQNLLLEVKKYLERGEKSAKDEQELISAICESVSLAKVRIEPQAHTSIGLKALVQAIKGVLEFESSQAGVGLSVVVLDELPEFSIEDAEPFMRTLKDFCESLIVLSNPTSSLILQFRIQTEAENILEVTGTISEVNENSIRRLKGEMLLYQAMNESKRIGGHYENLYGYHKISLPLNRTAEITKLNGKEVVDRPASELICEPAMHCEDKCISPAKKRVLIGEENTIIAQQLKKYFGELGFDVILVSNDQELLSIYRDYSFDLIVVELTLPTKGGLALRKLIRDEESSIRGKTPVIGISAHELPLKDMASFDRLILKPLHLEKIASAVGLLGINTQ